MLNKNLTISIQVINNQTISEQGFGLVLQSRWSQWSCDMRATSITSGQSLAVMACSQAKGLPPIGSGNARCKTGSVTIVLSSSLQMRLTCPSQINSPFLRVFALNFKFGKGRFGSLPFGGKSAWRVKFNIDACGLFFTRSVVGFKFIKNLPLKFGEASMSFWLLASGLPPKTGANFINAKTAKMSKTIKIRNSIKRPFKFKSEIIFQIFKFQFHLINPSLKN